MINFRENWRGYLWQRRFSLFPKDIDLRRANPFKANIATPVITSGVVSKNATE